VTWQFALTGLLIGTLVGMTGMGGGSLMTPILILLFGFQPTVAVGTDILHGAIFKSFGAVRHRMLNTVHVRLAAWMFAGSAPFSLLGVALATWIEHHYGKAAQTAEGRAIGVALVLGGTGFLIKTFLTPPEPRTEFFVMTRRDKVIALLIGIVCGFVVGLTSVGSGTFFGLMMLLLFPLATVQIVGTDILQAAALLWVAGFGHFVAGNVNLHATGWLLVGSIPGVLIGSHLSVRLPDRLLRVALSATLSLSGIKLLDLPHGDAIVVVGLGLWIAALFFWGVRFRRGKRLVPVAGTD
jgi:uncharacterized membrane protein YfcA